MESANQRAYRINRAEVQKLRSGRPISDKQLASRVKVHIKTLRKWLNRGEPAYLENILALAQALGVADDYHTLIDTSTATGHSSNGDGQPPTEIMGCGTPPTATSESHAVPPALCDLHAVNHQQWQEMCKFALNLRIKGVLASREQLVVLDSIKVLVANELKKAGIIVTSTASALHLLSYTIGGSARVLLFLRGDGNEETIDPWWQLLAVKPERMEEFLASFRADNSVPRDFLNIEHVFMSAEPVSLRNYSNRGKYGESLAFRLGTYAIEPYDSDIQRAAEVFQFDPKTFWSVVYDLRGPAWGKCIPTISAVVAKLLRPSDDAP